MADVEKYYSDDFFFYYGDNDLKEEIEHDLLEQAMQPHRSYYYNRQEAIGISQFENYPNTITLYVLIPYVIANGVAFKNTIIEDGSYSDKDRRVIVSQATISIRQGSGVLSVNIGYLLSFDIEQQQNLNFKV